jgi:tetratricopeptide (TPR) repeat protein
VPSVADMLSLALQNHREGKLSQAGHFYQKILETDPNHADARHLLGVVAYQLGRLDDAAASIGQSLLLDPKNADYLVNLGLVFQAQGKLDEAITSYREALQQKPGSAEALNNLGSALLNQDKLDEAEACYRQALRLNPSYAKVHNNLGLVLARQDKLTDALSCYRQAIALKPDYSDAFTNLGNVQRERRDLDGAVASYQQTLRLEPNHVGAQYSMGIALTEMGRLEEALTCFKQSLRLMPDLKGAYDGLGVALTKQAKFPEALASFEQAIEREPHEGESHLNRAIVWLLQGDWSRGWPEYEWRWRTKGFNREVDRKVYDSRPLWDGSSLAGKTILLHAEQGLGDTLQFIRYAPLVKERGAKVIVACQPPLLKLLANAAGIDQLIAQGTQRPHFDVQAPLLSLPGIFHSSVDSLPAIVPYLQANTKLVEFWRGELQSSAVKPSNIARVFKVGIAGQGSPTYRYDRQRSIPLAYLASLAKIEGVQLISLQKGAGLEQVTAKHPILDLADRLDEASGAFMDTAAVMMNIDLVVCSDSAIAHLAGALGVPVWLALPHVPDWRWLFKREDSPWYPTMRLFRQTRLDDWDDVFKRIAGELAHRVRDAAQKATVKDPRLQQTSNPA